MHITSTELQQNVGRFPDAAQHAPVAITKSGRTHTVPPSAAMLDILVNGRVARPVEDLDDETLKATAESAVAAARQGIEGREAAPSGSARPAGRQRSLLYRGRQLECRQRCQGNWASRSSRSTGR